MGYILKLTSQKYNKENLSGLFGASDLWLKLRQAFFTEKKTMLLYT